jgi:hypothetical protein
MKKNLEKKGSILYSTKATNINDERVKYFENSVGSTHDKINSFTRYSSRQNIAKLIAQYKLIELSKDKLGDIIEAGVYFGSGLMGWASIATSLEPFNYQCKILGFDTFKGSTGVSKVDQLNTKIIRREGEYKAEVYEDLQKSIKIFNEDRPINHLEKIRLIKGDISKTSKIYVKHNPDLNIRILHIGMNLYKPTYETLKAFYPSLSKGSIVAIDGLNYATGGCMEALKRVFKLQSVELKTFDFYPNFTYFKI